MPGQHLHAVLGHRRGDLGDRLRHGLDDLRMARRGLDNLSDRLRHGLHGLGDRPRPAGLGDRPRHGQDGRPAPREPVPP